MDSEVHHVQGAKHTQTGNNYYFSRERIDNMSYNERLEFYESYPEQYDAIMNERSSFLKKTQNKRG